MSMDPEWLAYEAGELELLAIRIESADPDIAKYIKWLERRPDGLAREAERLRERLDHVSSALRGSTKERKRLRGERDNARRWADGEPGAVRDW